MSQRIEEKKRIMNAEVQAFQSLKYELLELIRMNPDYFTQLLAQVGDQKVELFLDKDEKYRSQKQRIEKMKEEIFEDEMKEREAQVKSMNLPDAFRRACVSATCSVCLEKHNWTEIMMLTCGHVFHGDCVKELKSNKCPECRRKIDAPKMGSYGGGIFGGHHDADDY